MSMMGNIAISGYISSLLKMIEEERKTITTQAKWERLVWKLVEKMEQDKKDADSGWL